jgi:hypothetical protein
VEDVWYRDKSALRFIALRYLPLFAVLNYAWEWAHVRLYTIWVEADIGYISFAVAHCTVGDVLIGTAALAAALTLSREGPVHSWRRARIAILSAVFGAAYTVASEWMNVSIRRSWAYAESMPTVNLGSFEIGLTPVLQWLVIAPLTLYLARKLPPAP